MTSSLLDRSQYPCLRDSVYLNQASLGLIGQPAVAAMHSFLENVARHGNLYRSDSDEINYGHALRGVAGRCFITIHHASPFSPVQASSWDSCLCYFASSPMPQFSQFPPTFLQLLAHGFANSILKKSMFVLSMTCLIVTQKKTQKKARCPAKANGSLSSCGETGRVASMPPGPLYFSKRRSPIGNGPRCVWRFRLSELAGAVSARHGSVFTSEATHSIKLVKTARKKAYPKLSITTQAITAHILDDYLLTRRGENFALDIEPDEIEELLDALALASPTKEKIRRVMNVVYRRGQKSRLLPRTGDGNPVAFVTQSSKSSYKAIIVSLEQAFRIMMELGEPFRTLVFLVAETGLRISEALGLKWSDLDYERQMIHPLRVWVGNDLVPRLKTDGSEAPVPLGDLLADALQSWHRNTLYAKPDDWVFPSTKMKGKTPLSASMMARRGKVGRVISTGCQHGQRGSFQFPDTPK